jgi:hypothetical protein
MAAKKAPKKPKFTPRPYKPRKPKPKPRRTDDEILADARKELKKITDGPKFIHRPYKPRKPKPKAKRSHSEIRSDARKELKRINSRPKFSHRPYKPKRTKPKGPIGTESYHAKPTQHLRETPGESWGQSTCTGSLGDDKNRPPLQIISTDDPTFPVGFSSKHRGQAGAGLVISSEIFFIVFERCPLNLRQMEAFRKRKGVLASPMENLYSTSVYYRKSRSPSDSDMPVLVYSLAYANSQLSAKIPSLRGETAAGPTEPETLGLFRYAATGTHFMKFLTNNFDAKNAYSLLFTLALRELEMRQSDFFHVGTLQDVKANNPSIS